MTRFLLSAAEHFGYVAVFLGVGLESMGIPLPGETTLVIAAVLAGQGVLNPVAVPVVGFFAAVIGDNTGFFIGRSMGRALMRHRPLDRFYTPGRIARAEQLMVRHGMRAVFLGRFIAILRIFAGPLAGMHGMRWPRFLIANASGAAIWVAAVTAVGLLVGSNLDRALAIVGGAGWVGLALAVVIVATGALFLRKLR